MTRAQSEAKLVRLTSEKPMREFYKNRWLAEAWGQ